jgi:hypothetical protein
LKSITRRELLTEFFSKDMLKNFAGAYREFNKAQEDTRKFSCDEAGLRLGKKSKKYLKRITQTLGKEG